MHVIPPLVGVLIVYNNNIDLTEKISSHTIPIPFGRVSRGTFISLIILLFFYFLNVLYLLKNNF